MKKIFFLGNINEVNKNIYTYLSHYFQVQMCNGNVEAAKGMLKVYEPDLVLISLVGLNEMHKDFFADMHTNYKKTPVITIGTDAECSHFEAYYQFKQFQNLNRPTNNSTIMEKLCTMLELDINKIINSYERSIDKRKRILLVDDDAVFLWDMREILKEQYQVFVALSVTQAMTLIGKKSQIYVS